MKVYSVTRTIHATPESIWQILTKADAYPEWDPGMDRIEGSIASGETIKVYNKLSPGRAFPVKVSDFVPGQTMRWTGGMPLGLFKGQRTFTLTPRDDGATEFTMLEAFTGVLLPLIGRSLPDFTEPFEQFSDGLKPRAEAAE